MTDSKIPQSREQKKKSRLDKKGVRTFGGKTENFENNRERHFYQRMLKAYLKGSSFFRFGFEKYEDGQIKRDSRGNAIPATFEVL